MTGASPDQQPTRDTEEDVEGHGSDLPDSDKTIRGDHATGAGSDAPAGKVTRPAPKMRH